MSSKRKKEVGRSHPSFDAELGRRISLVIEAYGTKTAAADAVGRTTEALRSYERGENEPPFSVLQRLAHGKGFSLDWLATGRGPMQLGDQAPTVRQRAAGPDASEMHLAPPADDAVIDRLLQGLTQRGLKEWATTIASWGARNFSAELVGAVVQVLETVQRIKGVAPSPEAKKVAVIVMCDHFEKAGKDQDAVLGNVVRLFA